MTIRLPFQDISVKLLENPVISGRHANFTDATPRIFYWLRWTTTDDELRRRDP
jgi:hypothetical protein